MPLNPDIGYTPAVYWETQLSRDFDSRGTGFPHLSRGWNEWLYRQLRHAALRVLRGADLTQHVPDGRVLDVGSGAGYWVQFWKDLGANHVTGLDLTETSVGLLRQRHPNDTFIRSDIGGDRIDEDRCFDLISVMAVLQHITDDASFQRALCNLSRLLAPGGSLLVMDPIIVHRVLGNPKPSGAITWLRSLGEWKQRLAHAGLYIVDELLPVTFLLATACDTRNEWTQQVMDRYWWAVSRHVGQRERLGQVLGGCAFAVDRILVHTLRQGVSTKMFLLRASDA